MKFLAIDTSGKHLTVLAYNGETPVSSYSPDCALQHSVRLMDEIDCVLKKAGMVPSDCDFFGVVIGPGSFTGIRIGIATVKGLCFATGKPAVAVTSFDEIAYAGKGECVALVDAGHGYVYACAYDGKKEIVMQPCYLAKEELLGKFPNGTFYCAEETAIECEKIHPTEGLYAAILQNGHTMPAEDLIALYIRKSSAEEKRG